MTIMSYVYIHTNIIGLASVVIYIDNNVIGDGIILVMKHYNVAISKFYSFQCTVGVLLAYSHHE